MSKRRLTTDTPQQEATERRKVRIRYERLPADPLDDVQAKLAAQLPKDAHFTSRVEDPIYPTYFAIFEVELGISGLPNTNGQLPFVDPQSLRLMDEKALIAQQTEVFGKVLKHRRCTACWGNYKGKAQRKQRSWRRINSKLIKVYYSCDCCGNHWPVVVETHRSIREIDGVLQVQDEQEFSEKFDGANS